MRLHLLLAVTAVLFLVATASPQEGAKKDVDKIQGKWAVVALENDGKALPPEALKGSTFEVKGNKYILKGGEDTYQGALTLDQTGRPKLIDATFVDAEGKEKGKAVGIYELDGDSLKICWREKGDQRPTELASKPGSGTRLIILRREK